MSVTEILSHLARLRGKELELQVTKDDDGASCNNTGMALLIVKLKLSQDSPHGTRIAKISTMFYADLTIG